jgi:hypothetical protein
MHPEDNRDTMKRNLNVAIMQNNQRAQQLNQNLAKNQQRPTGSAKGLKSTTPNSG